MTGQKPPASEKNTGARSARRELILVPDFRHLRACLISEKCVFWCGITEKCVRRTRICPDSGTDMRIWRDFGTGAAGAKDASVRYARSLSDSPIEMSLS